MKNSLGILLAVVTGSILAFFGVFVSVFADGGLSERLITISIILLIYSILSAVWGFLLPGFSWLWGFFLGLPGAFLLILYFVKEPDLYYLIYIILIIGFSCLSAKAGSFIRNNKWKHQS